MAANNSGTPRVTFLAPEKHNEKVPPKKLGKLTVKYNRKEIQRRLKLEEWIDAQIQLLYQSEDKLKNDVAEPEIDIDDFLDLSYEEQRSKLQELLKDCTKPIEGFMGELLQRLKGLKKISMLQRK
ncbi:protein phosphatase 1 regulatory subunit 14D [Bombina bombina]|uniref:protein phosphatase 1 regulatory subunit 14D n=1 Tax=Bombina bombina TaxID=8345 RepID=UPI00235B067D|nr:protein phosphatase 1 regulatory subunit 14D [Bombina bombina]